jgi:hypothetical protein
MLWHLLKTGSPERSTSPITSKRSTIARRVTAILVGEP